MHETIDLAPIAIFTYNRPEHTKRLLDSLKQNPEFSQSPVTIYCDGSKTDDAAESVAATRAVVEREAPSHADVVMRDKNFGLAKSIITGVGANVDKFGKVIVAEDDLVFSKRALKFLNDALIRYENNDQAMHVAAYMYPVNRQLPDAFFYREATCWGWGTWRRAWMHFEPDATKLVSEINSRKLRFHFDVDGAMYFYQMLEKQAAGEIDSWAIRWYASIVLAGGLSLHPARSYVENNGFDGSGVHCNIDNRFIVETVDHVTKSWPQAVEEDKAALKAMIDYRSQSSSTKRNLWQRLQRVTHKLQRPFA